MHAPEYVDRHILGLIAEHREYDGAGLLTSRASFAYDLPGAVIDQGAVLHHNSKAFGASVVKGRGLLSKIVRTPGQIASNSPSSPSGPITTDFTYNTTGALVEKTDSTGRHSVNHYDDAYSDGQDRRTLAFITSASTNGDTTTSQFDFATGKRVLLQRGAEGHSFTYDDAGRMVAHTNLGTGASARRVFDETGTVVATFSKGAGRPGSVRDSPCWTAWA